MRIISQHKNVDMPYEKYAICYFLEDGEYIMYAFDVSALEDPIAIASYKSEERCLEVMQSIRERYNIGAKFYQMPEE